MIPSIKNNTLGIFYFCVCFNIYSEGDSHLSNQCWQGHSITFNVLKTLKNRTLAWIMFINF